jgi:hypothetical protein
MSTPPGLAAAWMRSARNSGPLAPPLELCYGFRLLMKTARKPTLMDTPEEPPSAAIYPLIRKPSPPTPPEGNHAWPEEGSPYQAYAGLSCETEMTLTFLRDRGTCVGVPYARLERIEYQTESGFGGNERLSLRFACSGPMTITVEGRNLRPMAEAIGQHRLSWLREWPLSREEADSMNTVILRIVIGRGNADHLLNDHASAAVRGPVPA